MHVEKYNTQMRSFKAFYFQEQETQDMIIKNLNNKQLETLVDIFDKESKNPVNALIYSNNSLLNAKIICKYKIDKFKEHYKQVPFFESKFKFLKRVANIIHKYNESLCYTQ